MDDVQNQQNQQAQERRQEEPQTEPQQQMSQNPQGSSMATGMGMGTGMGMPPGMMGGIPMMRETSTHAVMRGLTQAIREREQMLLKMSEISREAQSYPKWLLELCDKKSACDVCERLLIRKRMMEYALDELRNSYKAMNEAVRRDQGRSEDQQTGSGLRALNDIHDLLSKHRRMIT